ncbi:MAG: hypothetical protein FGF52_04315 [Candidatus Brockarchaeota archaeon]|nr:hypothetical protein [Candidatus Brockarchaeota archaeon]
MRTNIEEISLSNVRLPRSLLKAHEFLRKGLLGIMFDDAIETYGRLRVRCFETDQSGVTDFNGRVSFRMAGSGFEVTIYPAKGKNGITAYEKARVRL